jgi:hypothetical protein
MDPICQGPQFLVEPFGLNGTDTRIEAGDDADQGRLAQKILVGDRLEASLEEMQGEVRGWLTDLQFISSECHGVTFEGDDSRTSHRRFSYERKWFSVIAGI